MAFARGGPEIEGGDSASAIRLHNIAFVKVCSPIAKAVARGAGAARARLVTFLIFLPCLGTRHLRTIRASNMLFRTNHDIVSSQDR
jgi:hypothetical protein